MWQIQLFHLGDYLYRLGGWWGQDIIGGEEFVDPYYFCQSVVFVYFNDQRPFKIPKSHSEHHKLN